MAAFLDLCRFIPTLGGTTDFVYSAAVGGCQGPAAAGAQNGIKYKLYAVSNDLTQWELFEGAYNSATGTFPRTIVLANSNGTGVSVGQTGAGTKIAFSTVPQVSVVGVAEDLISLEVQNGFSAAQQAQARGNLYASPLDALAFNGMQYNGSVEASQINGTTAVAVSTGAQVLYFADGWQVVKSGTSVLSAQQVAVADLPGFTFAARLSVTTAQAAIGTDYVAFRHAIEGTRFYRAAWGTAGAVPIAAGMWVCLPMAGTYQAVILNAAQTVSAAASFNVTTANVWQYVTMTFPAQTTGAWATDNTVGADLRVYLDLAGQTGHAVANTSYVCRITGLVVLPGVELPSAARSPFITRPIALELPQCQRYVTILGGVSSVDLIVQTYVGAAGNAFTAPYPLPVRMRIVPAASIVGTVATSNVTATNLFPSPNTLTVQLVAGGAGSVTWQVTTGSFLLLDARM